MSASRQSATKTKKPASSARNLKRSYSAEEKGEALAVLDANEGNVLKTAEQLGIPRKTLEGWSKDRATQVVNEIRQIKKAELAQKFGNIVDRLLDLVLEDLPNLPPQVKLTGLGIATDKWLLLNDQPTGIQQLNVNADNVATARAAVTEWEQQRFGESNGTADGVVGEPDGGAADG